MKKQNIKKNLKLIFDFYTHPEEKGIRLNEVRKMLDYLLIQRIPFDYLVPDDDSLEYRIKFYADNGEGIFYIPIQEIE